ncbi:ABC transporter C family member 9 [Hordeum vulgare]|nr:ABC transporter C family member 9 [Hordeum vulgare]
MVMRTYGTCKLQQHIRSDVAMAKMFECLVGGDPRFEVVVPRNFAMVCFRIKASGAMTEEDADEANRVLMKNVNKTGKAYLSHTVVGDSCHPRLPRTPTAAPPPRSGSVHPPPPPLSTPPPPPPPPPRPSTLDRVLSDLEAQPRLLTPSLLAPLLAALPLHPAPRHRLAALRGLLPVSLLRRHPDLALRLLHIHASLGLLAVDRHDDALALCLQMDEEGAPRDGFTFESALRACSGARSAKLGRAVHRDALTAGLAADVSVCDALVEMYAQCGDMEMACQVFDAMPERDAVSWNILLGVLLGHGGLSAQATEAWRRMLGEGHKPDSVVLSAMLWHHPGDGKQGREVHAWVIRHWLETELSVANALIGMYSRKNRAAPPSTRPQPRRPPRRRPTMTTATATETAAALNEGARAGMDKYEEGKVSADRVAQYLQEEELKCDAITEVPRSDTDYDVEIDHGAFSWELENTSPTITDVNLKVKRGVKVAICGMVGSGKSSLLSCILGEMPRLAGAVRVSGSRAYVPQTAWILSGNIRDNILFGNPYDKEKYQKIIQACALTKDLELFANGDLTEIGERGINMSGGQKQRIQIARSVYEDADIYLFDDPFSAVDAHTGAQLFKDCFMGMLENKTILYVTHQVEFLPAAILGTWIMDDGCFGNRKAVAEEKKVLPEGFRLERHVTEELNIAYAYHEFTSLENGEIFKWFDSHMDHKI